MSFRRRAGSLCLFWASAKPPDARQVGFTRHCAVAHAWRPAVTLLVIAWLTACHEQAPASAVLSNTQPTPRVAADTRPIELVEISKILTQGRGPTIDPVKAANPNLQFTPGCALPLRDENGNQVGVASIEEGGE